MISYCANIHPVHSWVETISALDANLPEIKRHLQTLNNQPNLPTIGLGLWLSNAAVETLSQDANELINLQIFLQKHDCEVETMNAFPYGHFHGKRVKESVFRPDWSSTDRLTYTCRVADILSQIGKGDFLSISTLPGSHKTFSANRQKIWANVEALTRHLHHLYETTGKLIKVGFEPEPFGLFDNTWESIEFFNELKNFSRIPHLIEKHIGITYDTCHFALQNENPKDSFNLWNDYNIDVVKIQFSNALAFKPNNLESLVHLAPFNEPIYFHQTRIDTPQSSYLFPDLNEALAWAHTRPHEIPESHWKIHYHIPVHHHPQSPFLDTSDHLKQTIEALSLCPTRLHLEVETYTWQVLPQSLQSSLSQQVAAEIHYIEQLLPLV